MATMTHLSTQCCRYCKGPLTVHEAAAGGVCAEAACQKRKVLHSAVLQEHERREVRRQRAQRVLESQLSTSDSTSGCATEVVVVPALQLGLTPLPVKRRREFARHLIGLTRSLAGAGDPVQPSRGAVAGCNQPDPAEATGKAFAVLACSTCQGQCCRSGGNHAFIRLETLQRYRISQPALTGRELIRHYLRFVPSATYANSCLFHGAGGCALPRRMRSATCEAHFCRDMKELFRLRSGEIDGPLWIAAINDYNDAPVRCARFSPQDADERGPR